MNENNQSFYRPLTAFELSFRSNSLEEFGYNLRDWQHELKKVSSRSELIRRFTDAPKRLKDTFEGGEIADAYLAGYVAYLADKAKISRPQWTIDPERISETPWFSSPDRKRLIITTPSALREKNIFTEPENVITLRKGRPRVSEQQKRKTNAIRQKRYREKIKEELTAYRNMAKLQKTYKSGRGE